ncbi:MAG: alpha/beta fold hydrolase [Pseudomonadota bacterium]
MTVSAVRLNHMTHPATGTETRPPLLIAHGLFGSARNFNTLGRRLATDRRVVLVDMRNHGESPWSDETGYEAMASDLAGVIERECGGHAMVLGHSMGGKSVMALALTRGELVAGAIVADIAPVVYDHSHQSFLKAMQAVDLTKVSRRSDADPMLADAIPEAPLRAFILQNLDVSGGTARWRLNIAALDRGMDDLIGWPPALETGSYTGPVLFLHGGQSDYVTVEGEEKAQRLFPMADFHAIPGTGHWLHAEAPDVFREVVEGWLRTVEDA